MDELEDRISAISCVDGITFIGKRLADTTNHEEIRLEDYTGVLTSEIYRGPTGFSPFIKMKTLYREFGKNKDAVTIKKRNITSEQSFYLDKKDSVKEKGGERVYTHFG